MGIDGSRGLVTADGWAGLGIPSTVLMAAVWGVVAAVAGTWLARVLAGSRPGLAARLGGRRLDPGWRILLADATLRRREQPHPALAATADDLRAGRIPPPPRPLTVNARRDRLVALGVVGVLVLALVAGVTHAVVQHTVYTRERAVTAYLDAVRAHDAHAALAQVGPTSLPKGATPLLVDGAMGTLPDHEIEAVDDATGAVTVRFTVDGTPVRRTFETRQDTDGLFHGYRLVDPFSALSVQVGEGVAKGSVKVGSVAFDTSSGVAFPGVYQVTASPAAGMEVAPVKAVALEPEVGASVQLVGKVSAKAQQAAEAAVKAYVDACAAQAVAQPKDCPFNRYTTNYKSAKWQVKSYPSVEVHPDGDHLAVATTNDGLVNFSGTQNPSFITPTPENEDLSYHVSGRLEWDGQNTATARLSPSTW